MSGRHSADDWQCSELPVLVYRHWLPGDPEWTFPRHAQRGMLMLTRGDGATKLDALSDLLEMPTMPTWADAT